MVHCHRIIPRATALLGLLVLASGCLVTPLERPPPVESVFRVAAGNPRPIGLSFTTGDAPQTVGRQFLFLVVPFGRVEVPHPAEFLRRTAYERLALAGIRPVVDADSAAMAVSVDSVTLDVDAYDLLVTRRVVATVSLAGTIHRPAGTLPWSAVGHAAEFHALPFAGPLSRVLDLAAADAFDFLASDYLRGR